MCASFDVGVVLVFSCVVRALCVSFMRRVKNEPSKFIPGDEKTKDYHGAAGTVWDGTGVLSPPQAETFWAPVVNGTGSHRQFFCSRCDGMGRDNFCLDGTGTGREMSHAF